MLSLTARYGKDLPVINGGLVWRVFADKPDDTGTFKLIREERGATPNIVLPPAVTSSTWRLAWSARCGR